MERIIGSSGDILVKIELPVEGSDAPARLIFDEDTLVKTLYSGSALHSRFTGNKDQARILARRMAAGQDLYAACQNALWLLDAYGRETDEMYQSIRDHITDAIGYADGIVQIKAEAYREEGK